MPNYNWNFYVEKIKWKKNRRWCMVLNTTPMERIPSAGYHHIGEVLICPFFVFSC